MRARVLSAAVLAPLAVVLTVLGGVAFLAGVAATCAIACWEAAAMFGALVGHAEPIPAKGQERAARSAMFGALLERAEGRYWRAATAAAAVLLLVGVYAGQDRPRAPGLVAAAVLVASLVALVAGGAPARRFAAWAAGVASLVYVAGLGAHLLLLRATGLGLTWTLLACVITWGTDIGAFFAGRQFGKRGFFPAISPKKTLEGALGGLAAGAVAGTVLAAATGLPVTPILLPLVALSASAAAQAGDLAESLLKREAGVKDSGTLIPGHGGVLDRIDSLLLAVTVLYYCRLLFP